MSEGPPDLEPAAGLVPALRSELPGRQHCPTCGAPRHEEATCYRCKSDLAPLLNLEREADGWHTEARRCYAQGWYRQAAALAQRALRIEASSEDLKLLVCACLRCGDFQTACRACVRLLSQGA